MLVFVAYPLLYEDRQDQDTRKRDPIQFIAQRSKTMNKKNKILFIAGLFGICLLMFACDEKKGTSPPDKVSLTITPIEVQGVLETSDAGLTLFDGEKTYLLETDRNMEEIRGEVVLVSGSLRRDSHGVFIHVDHVGLVDSDMKQPSNLKMDRETDLARE